MALPVDQPLIAAESTIPIADIALVEGSEGVIGHGALGEVRRATWGGTTVALKDLFMLRTDTAALARMGGALDPELRAAVRAKFARECDFMRRARHPNVLQFVGVVVDGECQPQYLATELGPGELFAYHKSRFCVITYGSWQHNAISMQGLLSSKIAKTDLNWNEN